MNLQESFYAGSIWWGRNGTWFNATPSVGATTGRVASFTPGTVLFPCLGVAGAANIVRLVAGAADQVYAPPTGFVAWG